MLRVLEVPTIPVPMVILGGGPDRGGRSHEEDRRNLEGRKDGVPAKSDKPKRSEGNPKSPDSTKCFRCTEIGHHQLDCTNDPVCYKCKQSGHMAVECASLHSRKLKMFGFGIPGQGFYSMEIPDDDKVEKFGGLITVLDGEASKDKLDKELKHLVHSDWDYNVKEFSRTEFGVSFPDQGSLDTLAKFSGVELALFGLRVKITKPHIDPAASSVLQSAWVQITGVPSFAKKEDVIKEITSLVAEPVKVDSFSLTRDEPVRVRVNCRDPSKLRGFVEIFFNGVGYEIKFQAEGSQGGYTKGGGPPGPGKSDDKQGGSGKKNNDNSGKNKKRGDGRMDKQMDREFNTSQGDSQDDSMEDLIRDDSPMDESSHLDTVPLAAFHPDIGLIQLIPQGQCEDDGTDKEPAIDVQLAASPEQQPDPDQTSAAGQPRSPAVLSPDQNSSTDFGDSQTSLVTSQEETDAVASQGTEGTEKSLPKLRVHNAEGTYYMDADKWPNLVLPQDDDSDIPSLTQEQDLSNVSMEVQGGQGWCAPPSKKKKSRSSKTKNVTATGASSRIPRDGVPIADKAIRRAQERNDLSAEMAPATEIF